MRGLALDLLIELGRDGQRAAAIGGVAAFPCAGDLGVAGGLDV